MPSTGSGPNKRNDSTDCDEDPTSLNRRRLLALAGSGITMGMAGCGGDDGGSPTSGATPTPRVETEIVTVEGEEETVIETRTVRVTEEETPTATEGDGMADQTLRVPININRDLGSYHFNPFGNIAASGGRVALPNGADHYLLFGTLARYNVNTGEYSMDIADSLTVDGTTAQITLSDEYTFHNGDEVTAEDLATSYKVQHMAVTIDGDKITPRGDRWGNINIEEGVDAIRAVDDRTVEIDMNRELTEAVARPEFLIRDPSAYPAAVYNQFLEQWNDATTDDEKATIINEELAGFVWKEDAYGAGMWAFEEQVNDGFVMRLHEDHPHADQVNFNRLKLVESNNNIRFPQIGGNELDCSDFLGTGSFENLPTDWFRATTPSMGGWATMLNHESEIFSDRRVRQAFAHIIDSQNMVTAINPASNEPVPGTYNGTTGSVYEELTDQINFTNYESDDGDQRAASLLRDAGFSEQNGSWVRPNGDEWTPPVSTLAEWSSRGRAVVGMLNNFGINAELQAISDNYFGQYANGELEIAQDFWGSNAAPFPFLSYNRDAFGFPASSMSIQEEYELPPLGEPDGDATETFNVPSLIDQMATASSNEAYNDALQQLAWVRNQAVQSVPNTVRLNTGFYGQENFSWADPDDDVYGFNIGGTFVNFLMVEGKMQARMG